MRPTLILLRIKHCRYNEIIIKYCLIIYFLLLQLWRNYALFKYTKIRSPSAAGVGLFHSYIYCTYRGPPLTEARPHSLHAKTWHLVRIQSIYQGKMKIKASIKLYELFANASTDSVAEVSSQIFSVFTLAANIVRDLLVRHKGWCTFACPTIWPYRELSIVAVWNGRNRIPLRFNSKSLLLIFRMRLGRKKSVTKNK